MNNKRVFIEKKEEFNLEAKLLKQDFKEYLGTDGLASLRVVNIYDLLGEGENEEIISDLLFEKQVDEIYFDIDFKKDEKYFRVKEVVGQFNEREDSANEIIRFALGKEEVKVSHSKLFIFKGISDEEFNKIKKYYINPVELRVVELDEIIEDNCVISDSKIDILKDFKNYHTADMEKLKSVYGIAMDIEDLEFCKKYFISEDRDPSITEIKLIDTYWSDHCRHTTFMTEITNIEIEPGKYENLFQNIIDEYLGSREFVYENKDRVISLMDLATINQKEIKRKGLLDDKEDTEEVNAASIEIDVDVDGVNEKWLLMFKNETHNHPTEIEPFGGASTCLGGAIRDPLSGRSYVYQAMRITGSADPRTKFEDTIAGKLPQRKITRTARDGYSSYGYEIGAATGYVREIYDEGYAAKRMEVGALVAAAPKENVYRGKSEAGDVIVLVGGKTGRDGLGGAVGSSKEHTEDSLASSGAEVQKGNPKIERKIVRLFRNKEVSKMIKVCNDFGAGGVSVAIGELADSLEIDLNAVPLKYEGLNGTEIALSESQERMAVVLERKNLDKFLEYTVMEDLEATKVADVTSTNRLRMNWNDEVIVDLDRDFLDSNGIRKKNEVKILQPSKECSLDVEKDFIGNLENINIAGQKGLVEGFDFSIGGSTVLSPLGGKNRMTQAEGMVAKIPVLNGETSTCSLMSYGFDPKISKWSTLHGGYYAVIESVAKIVALGGSYEKIRLSFQEYFERIGKDKEKWGKPFTALLGAYKVQKELNIPAIGGKDSMSGSFENIDVPPTLISFAVTTDKVENIISPEFKKMGSQVGVIEFDQDDNGLLDLDLLQRAYTEIKKLVDNKKILSMSSVKFGGIARSIAEMSMGNGIGFEFTDEENIYKTNYGSIVIEFDIDISPREILKDLPYRDLGKTIENTEIVMSENTYPLEVIIEKFEKPLEEVFPVARNMETKEVIKNYEAEFKTRTLEKVEEVKVLIPVVSGSTGEYDLAKAFERVGGKVETYIIKTKTREEFKASLKGFGDRIKTSHIVAFPDGEVMGSEPEGSGKLYRIILNDENVKSSLLEHIYDKNRLVLGIGEGLSALIKVGLIECGRIKKPCEVRDEALYITSNEDKNFISQIVSVEAKSNLSPWLDLTEIGKEYTSVIATKNGKIVGKNLERLIDKGQVALVFKDNLTGSEYGIDGISSPCGKVFGTISSIERIDDMTFKNISKNLMENIFKAGVNYFL